MTPESFAQTIARIADATPFDALLVEAVAQAKLAILDVIGVAVAASADERGRQLREALLEQAGGGPASVIGSPEPRSATTAALVNGTLAHLLDYDDRGHASTHLFAALLATAESERATGPSFLRAYVLGRELRALLDTVVDEGRMDGSGPGSRGWHSTGVNGPIAAALGAGLLMGLRSAALASAMGTAASCSSGLIANFGTPTKPLHAGRAASDGVLAASLARRGLGGDHAAIDGPSGLFEALGANPDATRDLAARYGVKWDLAERGVRIKPYPSCTTTHPEIETARRLHDRVGPIDLDRIAHVRMDLRPFMLRRLDPHEPMEARFNMAHGVLTALADGAVAADDFGAERVRAYTAAGAYGRFIHEPGSPAMEVELTDGTVHREVLAPLRNLVGEAAVEEKFRSCTRTSWSEASQDRVITLVADLDGETLPSQLGQLLRDAGRATA